MYIFCMYISFSSCLCVRAQLRGMTVVTGMVQLAIGLTGVSGFALGRSGPLVLAPLLCILGFSIYRHAALLCSDHWGMAAL